MQRIRDEAIAESDMVNQDCSAGPVTKAEVAAFNEGFEMGYQVAFSRLAQYRRMR